MQQQAQHRRRRKLGRNAKAPILRVISPRHPAGNLVNQSGVRLPAGRHSSRVFPPLTQNVVALFV